VAIFKVFADASMTVTILKLMTLAFVALLVGAFLMSIPRLM
jgi:hypothetical protein